MSAVGRQWITLSVDMSQEDSDSDEALMLRYQAGDAAAFDQLYARHRGGLFRFMLRQCRSRAQVEELFQDVWMNLIQAKDRYRVEAQFRTYLYTLAHNRIIDYFRSHARSEAVLFETDDDAPVMQTAAASRTEEPHVRAESSEQGAAILKLLEAMPAPQREAFLLYEEGGLTVADIAAATGTNEEAAKSRLRYAMAKLKAAVADG